MPDLILLLSSKHDHRLRDDDRSDPEVLHYIKAENAFAEEQLEDLAGELVDDLIEEVDVRYPEFEESHGTW